MKNYRALQNGSDIRGVALPDASGKPVTLTPEAARDLSRAFAVWLASNRRLGPGPLTVAVGRDSRLSGEALSRVVCESLRDFGVQVLDCGMASTPAMFMSTVFPEIAADGAVMITASHLPWDRNGFKYFSRAGGLEKQDIADIVEIASAPDVSPGDASEGSWNSCDLMERYAAHLRQVVCRELACPSEQNALAGLRVVCDAGNGAGGFFVTHVLQALGADTSGSQFLEPDGRFPNHSPNPEDPEAMKSLSLATCHAGADLGILFDTDVDRSAAVDAAGHEIARNRIVALAASLISPEKEGSIIVTDSVTSDQLTLFLEEELGFRHLRYQRGYRNVIGKALALNAEDRDCPLAIETSGHAAFRENYFLDDGAYLATKIVIRAARLKQEGMDIGSLIAKLQEPAEAMEVRIPVLAEGFSVYADGIIQELRSLIAAGACTRESPCGGRCRCGMAVVEPNYEGIRVSCDEDNGDGWFLLRKSLHEPLLPLNIESNRPDGCGVIAKKVADLLDAYAALDLKELRSLGA